MTADPRKTNPPEGAKLVRESQDYRDLLFSVRRSVRYHLRRQRSFDRLHKFGATFSVFAGSATLATAIADGDGDLLLFFAAATAFFGAFEIVWRPAGMARLHVGLSRDFIELERSLLRAEDHLTREAFRELRGRRLEIEAREPPPLRVLDAICHDELALAMGYDESERVNVSRLQRLLADYMDINAHKLEKQVPA